MDMDLQELEDLAQGTHDDLQETPKKTSADHVNGQVEDNKENTTELSAKQTDETLTQASKLDSAPQNDAQQMAAKQSENRQSLLEQQMESKVN